MINWYSPWLMYLIMPFITVLTVFYISRYSGNEFEKTENWSERFQLFFLFFMIIVVNLFVFYIFMLYHELYLGHMWNIKGY